MALPLYDSALESRGLVAEIRRLWRYRGLVRLLTARNVTIRYKRSVLGVWWTVLNPMLTAATLFLVFSRVFRFATPGTPYVVFLLSGVLVFTLFSQGVVQAANSIVQSARVLTKVYVPATTFAAAAGVAALINFAAGLVPLFVIQVITGVGIPWTIVLLPIPLVLLTVAVTGVGLLIASVAIYFYDVFDITNVLVQLLGYLTPVFYPLSILPAKAVPFVRMNPLYSYLAVTRAMSYEGGWGPLWAHGVMVVSTAVAATVGLGVFGRSWKRLVVLI